MANPINFSDFFNFGDTSEPQKAIQIFDTLIDSLQKLSKEARATSGEYQKAIENVRKSSVEASNGIEKIGVATQENTKQLQQTGTATQKVFQENERLTKGLREAEQINEKLQAQIKRTTAARQRANKATIEEREAQRQANQEARLVARIKRAQEGSIEQLRARLGLVTIAWKNLSEEERENGRRGQRLVRVKRELTEELKRLEAQTGDTRRNVGNYTQSIVEAIKQTGGFAGQLTGLNASLGRGNEGVSGALSGIAGVIPKIGPLGLIFGAAVGGAAALAPTIAEINKQLGDTRNLTRLTGDSLRNLVGSIRATTRVFDQDYNEVLRTANALAKTFGITQNDAIELINEGFIRGADLSGELLDSLREYSVQFDAAGLSAETLVDIIARSTEQGIFSDKGVDAIKEATIRIRELPTATRDALRALGFDVQQLQSDLESGAISINDVIADVSKRLGQLGPQSSVVGQAIADIFGGPGEDAGLQFLLTLQDLNEETGDYTENLNDAQRANVEYLRSQQDVESALVGFSSAFESTGTRIRTFFNNIISSTIGVLNSLGRAFTSTETAIANFRREIAQSRDIEALTNQVEDLQKSLERPDLFDFFESVFAGFTGPDGFDKRVERVRQQIELLNERIRALREEQEDENKVTNRAKQLFDELTQALISNRITADTLRKGQELLSLSTSATAESYQKLVDALQRAAKANQILQTTIGDLEPVRSARQEVELLRRALEMTFGRDFLDTQEAFRSSFLRFNNLIIKQAELFQSQEEKKTEALKEQQDQRNAIIDAALETSILATNTGFDIFQNNLIREQEALQVRFQAELEAAGSNEQARAAIEARFQQRQRQLQIRQARSEKAQALFNIAVQTAENAVRLFAQTTPPGILSAFAIAQGALQAAAVASRPIPQFFKGKEPGGYEGLATVGEKGFELLERKGEVYKTPDKTTLTYVEKQDKIIDHKTSKMILDQAPGLMASYAMANMYSKDSGDIQETHPVNFDTGRLESLLEENNRLLEKTRTIEKGFDEHGIYHMIKEQQRWTKIRGSYKCRK